MTPEELKNRNFENELVYSTSRSGGPGGQNVNKLNTKVELRFSLSNTRLFSDEEKALIRKKLSNKINSEGELILVSQAARTQLMNKKTVTEKFYTLLARVLTLFPERRATRPTLSSVKKRIESKRNQGQKKNMRRQSEDYYDG